MFSGYQTSGSLVLLLALNQFSIVYRYTQTIANDDLVQQFDSIVSNHWIFELIMGSAMV